MGFQTSRDDLFLFFKFGDISIYLLVYVDDIIITCENEVEIHRLIMLLSETFSLNYMGYFTLFLGIKVIDMPSEDLLLTH